MAHNLNSSDDSTDKGSIDNYMSTEEKFNKCVLYVSMNLKDFTQEQLLKFYGLYKQYNEGQCQTPKPSWYDIKGKAKWEAWKSLGDMGQQEAGNQYVGFLLNILNADGNKQSPFTLESYKAPMNNWVSVSRMVQPTIEDSSEDISDFIRNGNISKVKDYIVDHPEVNKLDENGLGLIHYASDIGNVSILELLIEEGGDINLKDSEGQTALHYASSCSNIDCISFLIKNGADYQLKDFEGKTALEVASDDHTTELLQKLIKQRP